MSQFHQIHLMGEPATKFLQGQLTVNVEKLGPTPIPCAICNLKGRVQFGLWASKADEAHYILIIASDLMAQLLAHIKKYGAFFKFTTCQPQPAYPVLIDGVPSFGDVPTDDFAAWARASIERGNAWITADSSELFQPQELRLHQRDGVDYDKGCYLGQEIVARLYFKASPKAYLHRIAVTKMPQATLQAGDKLGKTVVVNALTDSNGTQALVVGVPDEVAQVGTILPLPDGMNGDVARH